MANPVRNGQRPKRVPKPDDARARTAMMEHAIAISGSNNPEVPVDRALGSITFPLRL